MPTQIPTVEQMATRFTRPQRHADYRTPDGYLVWETGVGTVLIPRSWYDGREAAIEAARAKAA